MELSRDETENEDKLPPETFAADRWVPCLVNEDEECTHIGCQAMEPLPPAPDSGD